MSIVHPKFKSSNNPNKVERNFYQVWSEMKRRCRHKTSERNNKSYLEKGITVCERWDNFDFFFLDMWSSYILHRKLNNNNTELDRVNNDKGYSKSNCRWVTRLENMNNTGNVRRIKGKTLTEWANILKVKREALVQRSDKGWSDLDVIRPFRRYQRHPIITS